MRRASTAVLMRQEVMVRTPIYPFVEVARYLHIPVPTLRTWCLTRRGSVPIIRLDRKRSENLSFLDVIEAHVLSATCRYDQIPVQTLRAALKFVSKSLHSDRPLVQPQFVTRGVCLLIEELGRIRGWSPRANSKVEGFLRVHLQRIDRDSRGAPIRLYPFTRRQAQAVAIRCVVMDVRIGFGRPTLVGAAVPTAVLADRFKSGDPLTELAADYGTQLQAIEEAIRFEFDRS